jgi:archaellum component FlaC
MSSDNINGGFPIVYSVFPHNIEFELDIIVEKYNDLCRKYKKVKQELKNTKKEVEDIKKELDETKKKISP